MTSAVTTAIEPPTTTRQITNVDTLDPMLPPAPPGSGSEPAEVTGRRRSRLWWVLGTFAGLVVAALIGAAFVQLPYYTFAPGSARPTEQLIQVQGADTYPTQGTISFTTVSIRHVTLYGLVRGWLDDDIEVVPEGKVLNGRAPQENRQYNQALMDNSKNVATTVALERLGYKVPVHANGAAVIDVQAGLPAADALQVGDVIVGVDGTPVEFANQLIAGIAAHAPGEAVTLEVQPVDGSATRTIAVRLVARQDDPEAALLGVVIQDYQVSYDFPFQVTIDSGSVGGPSAGLAFTLGVLDVLTPGELTGGQAVAVTGTINPDGSVGQVGGVAQKTAAVRRAGIHLFLVPSAEYDEAVAHAGKDLKVVKVDTLDDALQALAPLGGNALALPTPGSTATTDA